MALHPDAPKWQREIDSFLGIKSTFIIEGNIHDLYPLYLPEGRLVFAPLSTVLRRLIGGGAAGQYMQFYYSPLHGFYDPDAPRRAGQDPRYLERWNQTVGLLKRYEDMTVAADTDARRDNPVRPPVRNHADAQLAEENPNREVFRSKVIRTMLTEPAAPANADGAVGQPRPLAVIADHIFRTKQQSQEMEDPDLLFNLRYASTHALQQVVPTPEPMDLYNMLILIVDKRGDVPAQFFLDNPYVQIITIPRPDRRVRDSYIRQLGGMTAQAPAQLALPAAGGTAARPAPHGPRQHRSAAEVRPLPQPAPAAWLFPGGPEQMDRLVDLTDHLTLQEIAQLQALYLRDRENIADAAELVSKFKYGQKESVWTQLRQSLHQRDMKGELRARIKGQDQILDRVVTTIKRAVVGLSGVQHSSDGKPRGIFFLAGPTGTGKTELVKAVTKMLFGDERAVVRFDMSEFADASSCHRLFGAPPGYIGYGNGGELTNAVRSNPFSVLLFDEIEKAHETIMDKFLQILEDGRMTDGEGQTVFFSETLIFFTSNLGFYHAEKVGSATVRRRLVGPEDPYEKAVQSVDAEMKNSFKAELRNRLGDNVLVFRYIDEQGTRQIVDSKLQAIWDGTAKRTGVHVRMDERARQHLLQLCRTDEVRDYGGRGIVNVLESQLISPLGEFIFDNGLAAGGVSVSYDGGSGLCFAADGA